MSNVEINLPKHQARLIVRILESHQSSDVRELSQIGEIVFSINDEVNRLWDSDHDQQAKCQCSHPYERHFDGYDNMYPVGCKYCECDTFIEA